VNRTQTAIARWRARLRKCGVFGADGAVAVELALVAPFLITLILGVIDFGRLMDASQALAAAARVGAEYAMGSPICQAGIQVLNSPPVNAACTAGIQNAMQNSINFSPALTYPASFPLTCECDDKTSIACNSSCAAAGRPGPNRVFIRVSGSQSFSPLISWPTIPTTVNGVAEIRLP
jgi:Flp pilus assembly protein TadG